MFVLINFHSDMFFCRINNGISYQTITQVILAQQEAVGGDDDEEEDEDDDE